MWEERRGSVFLPHAADQWSRSAFWLTTGARGSRTVMNAAMWRHVKRDAKGPIRPLCHPRAGLHLRRACARKVSAALQTLPPTSPKTRVQPWPIGPLMPAWLLRKARRSTAMAARSPSKGQIAETSMARASVVGRDRGATRHPNNCQQDLSLYLRAGSMQLHMHSFHVPNLQVRRWLRPPLLPRRIQSPGGGGGGAAASTPQRRLAARRRCGRSSHRGPAMCRGRQRRAHRRQ